MLNSDPIDFCWPSVQAFAIIRFISGSPCSYMLFITFINPAFGSSFVDESTSSNADFFKSAKRFSVDVK